MTPRNSTCIVACWRRHAMVGAAMVFTAVGAIAAVGSDALAEGIKRGGMLIMARPDEPLTFDPFIPGDNGSIYAIEQVCDALVEADDTGRGLQARPGRIMGSLGRWPDLYFQDPRRQVQQWRSCHGRMTLCSR